MELEKSFIKFHLIFQLITFHEVVLTKPASRLKRP